MKFKESHFPANETATAENQILETSKTMTLSHCQIPKESDNDSDSSDLDLVTPNQPQQGPPSPGPSAQRAPQL